MAGSERVQEYLQKHRIGPLFEDLMAKVINDTPDDPCIYLSRILQFRSDRAEGRSSLKKSGEFDPVAVAKKSSYDKPWQTNSKRQTKELPSPTKTSTGKKTVGAKPEWNQRTKVLHESSNFDDIWDDTRTSKNGRPGSPPGKRVGRGVSAWKDTEEGEDVMFCTYGYRGPQKGRKRHDDPLMGELGLMAAPPSKATTGRQIKPSKKGARSTGSAQHKAKLEMYIKSAGNRSDSGYEDDRDFTNDGTLELLEDEDDLRREGVLNVKKSGVRISNAARRRTPAEANVRVSICATCAKVMGGPQPSEPAPGAKFIAQMDNVYDTENEPETDRPHTARFKTAPTDDDDDEFESVSQVTGPRRPVWQDSDQEAVTPRKGKSMLASNLSPSKGLPMYSSGKGPGSSGQKGKGHRNLNQSDDFFQTHRNTGVDAEPLRRTWAPMGGNNEDYSDDDTSGLDDNGGGWQVPPDYDTDSSFYGSPGARTQRADRAY